MHESSLSKIVSYTGICVCSGFYLLFMIYLANYGFGSPDSRHCYYVDGLDTVEKSREDIIKVAEDKEVPVSKGYPIDMAHLFRSWYLWAFWGSVFNLVAIGTLLSLYIYRKDLRHILRLVAGSITFIVVCNNMLWYLLGSLWRFSTAGRVASTERLTRNDSMSNYEWHDYLEAMSEASGY